MDDTDIIALCLMDDVEGAVSNVLESLLETNTKSELDLGLTVVSYRDQVLRDDNYYEVTIPRFSDDLFKEQFRMSRTTFEELLTIVGKEAPTTIDIKNCDLRKKLMYTLWIMAKQETFSSAGDRFGFAKSSGYTVYHDIVTIIANLETKYIKWPNTKRSQNIVVAFQRRSGGFPGVIGVVGACYIPIKGIDRNFYDWKTEKHSIVLQGTCDHKGRFTNIFPGMPGKMNKNAVFRESELYREISDKTFLVVPSNMHILGDTSYPLLRNLMIPFKSNKLTTKQTNYNTKLNKIEPIIKRAFNLLTSTFTRLAYLDCNTTSMANKIMTTACVLQNFLIDHGEINVDDEFEEFISTDKAESVKQEELQDSTAIAKRNAIAEMLL